MQISDEILTALTRRLRAFAGLELPSWVIESRAGGRARELGLDAEGYRALLDSPRGAPELSRLVEALRVGETRFFRHKAQFDAVASVVATRWREGGELRPKIWSAGCATGEEPYTLAMVLARALSAPAQRPSILATDVSEEALAVATRARYPAEALAHVPAPYADCFELRAGEAWLRREIAELVRFEPHNLASPPPARGLHLVFCRNVLIYFDPEARRRALARIVDALAPGGLLFVGYSETLRDVPGLEPVQLGQHALWQRPLPERRAALQALPEGAPSLPVLTAPQLPPARVAPRRHARVPGVGARELSSALSAALKQQGLQSLTVDLDAAGPLDDEVAVVLRRAGAAARASGIELNLLAEREVTRRWVKRQGLGGGGT